MINAAQRVSLSLDGGLTADQITQDLMQRLTNLGYDAAGARFIDPIWPPPPAGGQATELGLVALVRRLASLLAPGGGDLRLARLLAADAQPQGTATMPCVTIIALLQAPNRSRGFMTPGARSTPAAAARSTPAARGSAATSDGVGGRGAPPASHAAGTAAGDSAAAGSASAGGIDDTWDVDQPKQRRNNRDHPVLGVFMTVWGELLQKYWPAITKGAAEICILLDARPTNPTNPTIRRPANQTGLKPTHLPCTLTPPTSINTSSTTHTHTPPQIGKRCT